MWSERELAALLAALRFWQQEMCPYGRETLRGSPPLDGYEPLTADEIDRLCERLNADFTSSPPDDDGTRRGREGCECEWPGYFHSGVPGVIARARHGRLAPGARVERCDLCRRYDSDQAALERLIELSIAPPNARNDVPE